MDFRQFALLLKPLICGSSSGSSFVKTLFESMVTHEGLSALAEFRPSTYRSYLGANSNISRIAKVVSPYLESEEFVTYIHKFSDETVINICNTFRPYLPDITSFNAGERLADLFRQIILDASAKQRQTIDCHKTNSESVNTERPEAEVVDDVEASGAADPDKKITIIHQQTNVIQNGQNNYNLTNNGTITFHF